MAYLLLQSKQALGGGGSQKKLASEAYRAIGGVARNSIANRTPRGPKDQKNSRFRSGLKISSENEIFERARHRGPIFCGEIETSRLKFSSEIKNFDRDQKFRSGSNFLIVGPSGLEGN